MRRIASLWLPRWPTDRLERPSRRHGHEWGGHERGEQRAPAKPPSLALALAASIQGTLRLTAVNAGAALDGVSPGMTLADARALCPGLHVRPADPLADAEGLARLAAWCGRYTPWTAPDGGDGVRLDLTGAAHLFGGEAALLADLAGRLRGFGIAARAAIADSLGAAWAVARFGGAETAVVPPGGSRGALAALPMAALRLPAEMVETLRRLGLCRIGQLHALPRAALAARFGREIADRLDRALDRTAEPLSPERDAPRFWSRLAFPEPIAARADILRGAEHLLTVLCRQLERAGQGARRLDGTLYLADGGTHRVTLGLSRASRDPGHLMRLLAERLEGLDAGFGADVMTLAAPVAEPLAAAQLGFRRGPAEGDADLGRLMDRLGSRLGARNVARFAPHDSHLPERAAAVVAPLAPPAGRDWQDLAARPVRLLPRPEPVEVVAGIPDGPPQLFRWRGRLYRVRRADGPERLAPEWWREGREAATRDYYRIEEASGRRFWLYRDGLYQLHPLPSLPHRGGGGNNNSLPPCGGGIGRGVTMLPRWYLHGLFG